MSSDDEFAMSDGSVIDVDDDSVFGGDDENQAVNRVQAIKQATLERPAVLHASTNEGKKKKKRVEEIYQKKTQLEHILLRPDTYSKSVRRDGRTHSHQ